MSIDQQYRDAINSNDVCTIQQIYDERPDIVDCHKDFQYACKLGHLDLAKWFMTTFPHMKPQPKVRAMKQACKHGHIDVVKWLFNICGYKAIRKSIDTACKYGQLDIVRYMYQEIMRNSEFTVIRTDDLHYVCDEYDKYTRERLVRLACRHDHKHVLQYFLDKFECSDVAFIESCGCGKLDIAKYLHEACQLDISVMNDALKCACMNGHTYMVEWLLTIFDIDDYMDIFVSACQCRLSTVLLLVNKYPDIMNGNFILAFFKACQNGCVDVLQWMIDTSYVPHTRFLIKYFDSACMGQRLQIAQLLYASYEQVRAYVPDDSLLGRSSHSVETVEWLLQVYPMLADRFGNKCITSICSSSASTMRWLIDNYPQIDIHFDNESGFIEACNNEKISVIKLYTEYSDHRVSYHLLGDCLGYMISDTVVDNLHARYIEHKGLHIYTNANVYVNKQADIDLIIHDVDRIIACSKNKSAMS